MSQRGQILDWLWAGLDAVDPERLTEEALHERSGPLRVLAIGKAAAAMCRGAASTRDIEGLCVTDHPGDVPEEVELMIGDHPVPGSRSLAAGRRALELADESDIALISGGGSSLCEVPREGLTMHFVSEVNQRLLESGISIVEANLVRSQLSLVKSGGLGPLPTYIVSDVAGADPGVVSSGPTIPSDLDPSRAVQIMRDLGIEITPPVEEIINGPRHGRWMPETIEVIADGKTAARSVAECAQAVARSSVAEAWITGDFEPALETFLAAAGPGVTVAAGEPSVAVGGRGRGGRSTHVALEASRRIAGSDAYFAAMATDGVDGNSGSAGAIVDGSTWSTDADRYLSAFDSATYLESRDQLVSTGPTGTNVADLWLVWKPENGPESKLVV